MKYTIRMCVCDRCKKDVQLVGGMDLPKNWSLISSSTSRERSEVETPGANSMNYATVCDNCHSQLFGDFWSTQMSTNGGPDYVRRL